MNNLNAIVGSVTFKISDDVQIAHAKNGETLPVQHTIDLTAKNVDTAIFLGATVDSDGCVSLQSYNYPMPDGLGNLTDIRLPTMPSDDTECLALVRSYYVSELYRRILRSASIGSKIEYIVKFLSHDNIGC